MNKSRLVGWVLASCFLASDVARARQGAAPEALTSKVRELCSAFGALGMKFSSEPPIELLAPAEFEAGFARELEIVFGATHFEQQRYLRLALTLDAGRDANATRTQLAHAAALGVNVRYDFERGKLTVLATAAEAVSTDEIALTHELARAWRDQQSDLVAFFEAAPRTTEIARLRQSTLEGEAELASLAVNQARANKPVEHVRPEAAASLATAATGDAAVRQVRIFGRDVWLRAWRDRGSSARESLWSNPLTSTEQLLHLSKRGSDLPREVALPAWPEKANVGEVIDSDTLGELEVFAVLLEAGVPRAEAEAAALGWDGDRMQLVRAKTGELALVWRLIFDRHEDARQFATLWNSEALGQMAVSGPVFDWVRSDSVRLANALGEALRASVPPPAHEAGDRKTTEELERVILRAPENPPYIEGERWVHPRYGFSMPVPHNWNAEQVNGQVVLVGEARDAFRDVIGVVALENLARLGLPELLEQHRTNIGQNEQAKILLAEQRKVGGRDVLFLRYDVRPEPTKLLHLTSVVFLSGAKQVIVTATIGQETWMVLEKEIEKALNDLTFAVAAPSAGKGGR